MKPLASASQATFHIGSIEGDDEDGGLSAKSDSSSPVAAPHPTSRTSTVSPLEPYEPIRYPFNEPLLHFSAPLSNLPTGSLGAIINGATVDGTRVPDLSKNTDDGLAKPQHLQPHHGISASSPPAMSVSPAATTGKNSGDEDTDAGLSNPAGNLSLTCSSDSLLGEMSPSVATSTIPGGPAPAVTSITTPNGHIAIRVTDHDISSPESLSDGRADSNCAARIHADQESTMSVPARTLNWLTKAVGLPSLANRFIHGPLGAPLHQNRQYYLHLLEVATRQEQWHAAAAQLDILEGKEAWKNDPASPDYEYELVQTRLAQLKKAREIGDISSMIFLLRTSLSRNLGDIGNPALYSVTHVGTKVLIDDYIDEVVRHLNIICDTETPSLTVEDKLDFFLNTRQAFGRTALLLSGGATLGLNHIGVVKALHQCHLLPRIISGASVGSLIAALVCSKTDAELLDAIRVDTLNIDALEDPAESGSLIHKLMRFIKHGVMFDVEVLINCVRSNIGDVTFNEAYNRTRRILNVTVSSSTKFEMPKLLNYITAPNVLIWSAVAASCAVPFFYKSAPLMARDKNGNIVQWNPSGHRWIDGSVENDLPMNRLAEMFNVNHFIVCQVNPHVVPFIRSSGNPAAPAHPLLSGAFFLVKSEAQHRLNQLIELDVFPTFFYRLQNILSQRYEGDITIVPDVRWHDYLHLFSGATPERLYEKIVRGERATWPRISIIRNHCQIELCLDEILYRLRIRKLDQSLMTGGHTLQKLYADKQLPHNPYATITRELAETLQSLVCHPQRWQYGADVIADANGSTLAPTPTLSRSQSFVAMESKSQQQQQQQPSLRHTSGEPIEWGSTSGGGSAIPSDKETETHVKPPRRVKSLHKFQRFTPDEPPAAATATFAPATNTAASPGGDKPSTPSANGAAPKKKKKRPQSSASPSLAPSLMMTPISSGEELHHQARTSPRSFSASSLAASRKK